MPETIRSIAVLYRALILCGWVLFAVGCSEKPPILDTAKVKNPVGKPGQCFYCDKNISTVTTENYLEVRGNRYIVCDRECAERLVSWLAKQ